MASKEILKATKTRAMYMYYTPQNVLRRKIRRWLGVQQELEEIQKDLTRIMIKQMDMQDAFEKAGWMNATECQAAADINKGEMEG